MPGDSNAIGERAYVESFVETCLELGLSADETCGLFKRAAVRYALATDPELRMEVARGILIKESAVGDYLQTMSHEQQGAGLGGALGAAAGGGIMGSLGRGLGHSPLGRLVRAGGAAAGIVGGGLGLGNAGKWVGKQWDRLSGTPQIAPILSPSYMGAPGEDSGSLGGAEGSTVNYGGLDFNKIRKPGEDAGSSSAGVTNIGPRQNVLQAHKQLSSIDARIAQLRSAQAQATNANDRFSIRDELARREQERAGVLKGLNANFSALDSDTTALNQSLAERESGLANWEGQLKQQQGPLDRLMDDAPVGDAPELQANPGSWSAWARHKLFSGMNIRDKSQQLQAKLDSIQRARAEMERYRAMPAPNSPIELDGV